ncbi:hypothetical protein PF005_g19626 [Phytophthora fragariae]|uniref:Uncharacterized protein n=1 Tax=Phytophthora fragariae TaxID=53985 RepID=A0A6A4CQM4_9STRA|nr:hypothetical protein PF003_g6173 [Phytophthora fragariae]KAE8929854.1 hypothetical protein PF009_g20043 [Phytophthora fragariae]KAE9002178.1 hypothetical protein PF011_g13430 [Phytophthora fragariae]KAE9090630.1 hypothetical protein PF007_g19170 [Phytophthora fragariae]KAE9120823.1 hypothetical protein PF006_g18037 [Phytophthora fragariae]
MAFTRSSVVSVELAHFALVRLTTSCFASTCYASGHSPSCLLVEGRRLHDFTGNTRVPGR